MKLEHPLDIKPFRKRRAKLSRALGNGIVAVPTAPERSRNADTHYDYRWDSGFYYLTGFREPEAVLVLVLGDKPRSILFCREKNLEREIWDGYRYGPEAAREMFGFDEAYPMAYEDVDWCLRAWQAGFRVIYAPSAMLVVATSNDRLRSLEARASRNGGRLMTGIPSSSSRIALEVKTSA